MQGIAFTLLDQPEDQSELKLQGLSAFSQQGLVWNSFVFLQGGGSCDRI